MITAALNRALRKNAALTGRLQPFAGAHVALVLGQSFCWQISAQGILVPARAPADATLFIPLSAFPLLLLDRTAFSRAIRLEGDSPLGMAFAQTLSRLEWDMEEALSHLVGDVLAHRFMRAGRSITGRPQTGVHSLLHSLAEYYQYEIDVIAGKAVLNPFYQEVDRLRADTDRLEKRLTRVLTIFNNVTDK